MSKQMSSPQKVIGGDATMIKSENEESLTLVTNIHSLDNKVEEISVANKVLGVVP